LGDLYYMEEHMLFQDRNTLPKSAIICTIWSSLNSRQSRTIAVKEFRIQMTVLKYEKRHLLEDVFQVSLRNIL